MRVERSGSLLALATLLLAPCAMLPAHAASTVATGSGGLGASASIDFRIDVPKVMELQLLQHPATVDVTPDDVARGSVHVSGAQIKLVANNPRGYSLRADLRDANFTEVRIAGLQAPVDATRDSAVVAMPTMVGHRRPGVANVDYELRLAPNAQPGRYVWPVALSLQDP